MKKSLVGALVFAGTLAFTACNKEVVVIENGNGTENVADDLQAGEAVIEIGVSNTGVGSRASRPVGSSAAANDVDRVRLVAYKKNIAGIWVEAKEVTIKTVNDIAGVFLNNEFGWLAGPEGEGESTADRYGKQKVKLEGLEAGVTYKFVAYGYNNTDVYASNDHNSDLIFETINSVDGFDIAEIFAGTTEEITTASADDEQYKPGHFTKYVSVILERQVAGMLGYFENVPSLIGLNKVRYVKVVANKKMQGFKFPFTTEFNGIAAENSNDGDVLLTFDLSKIATNYDTVKDGAPYEFADWTNGDPEDGNPAPVAEGYKVPKGLKLKKNSMFGGRFIMPYDQHYQAKTLTVYLLPEFGIEPLKEFTITTNQAGYDKYAYDIRRNNFYSVGKKMKTDQTDPIDPTDPTDPDKPIDLTSNTDITVIINDAWDVLHDMGTED